MDRITVKGAAVVAMGETTADTHDPEFAIGRQSIVIGYFKVDLVSHVLERGDGDPTDGIDAAVQETGHELVPEHGFAPVTVSCPGPTGIGDGNGHGAAVDQFAGRNSPTRRMPSTATPTGPILVQANAASSGEV